MTITNNISLVDPLLQNLEQQIEQKIPAELKQMYNFIVVNGSEIMYHKSMTSFVKGIMDSGKNPALAVASGVAELCRMVYLRLQTERTKRGHPISNQQEKDNYGSAALFSCITLMCHALDMAEKLGKVQLTRELINQCVEATSKRTMSVFGISEQAVRGALAKAQQPAQPAVGA